MSLLLIALNMIFNRGFKYVQKTENISFYFKWLPGSVFFEQCIKQTTVKQSTKIKDRTVYKLLKFFLQSHYYLDYSLLA